MDGPGKAELLRALGTLSAAGKAILAAARAGSRGEMLQEFVSQKIGQLAGMINLYANFLSSSASVRDRVEDLMQFELEWNSFLSDVDARLKTNCFQAQLTLGTQVPGHMTFTDVRSGREVRLEEFLQPKEKLLLVLLRHFA
ncbi:selenoprotein L isoform X2 [Cetorhinus maximus]